MWKWLKKIIKLYMKNRSDKNYVNKCFAALEKAKDNEEEWTPELLNMLADNRFISFLRHSADM